MERESSSLVTTLMSFINEQYRFNTNLCFQMDLTAYVAYNYSRILAANMMAPIVMMVAFAELYSNWTPGRLPMFITDPGHYPTNTAS